MNRTAASTGIVMTSIIAVMAGWSDFGSSLCSAVWFWFAPLFTPLDCIIAYWFCNCSFDKLDGFPYGYGWIHICDACRIVRIEAEEEVPEQMEMARGRQRSSHGGRRTDCGGSRAGRRLPTEHIFTEVVDETANEFDPEPNRMKLQLQRRWLVHDTELYPARSRCLKRLSILH